MNNISNKTKKLTQTAMIAAVYAAITFATFFMSFGAVQYRVSEALTVLPVFTSTAVPGLTIGCALANLVGFLIGANPTGLIDCLFGTAASLIAAILTRCIGSKSNKRWIRYVFAPMPPVLINAAIVGFEISYFFMGTLEPTVLLINMVSVLFGQAVVCYGLGLPLMILLERNKLFDKIGLGI